MNPFGAIRPFLHFFEYQPEWLEPLPWEQTAFVKELDPATPDRQVVAVYRPNGTTYTDEHGQKGYVYQFVGVRLHP